ncbi:hypothetical protein [Flavobacterium panacagri]|uniref:hypothetical protein n=1 Tax=Flavobacterium panacagri TaxID=3034146 RepID=UPI0025A5ACA2|nr:hypothetical protein [Flavobacterium panacagri]
MNIEELEKKISFQISFLEFSGKTHDEVQEDLKSIAIEYANQFKSKADSYDILGAVISKQYINENGDELSEEDSENVDLGTIGEIAASHFGWL